MAREMRRKDRRMETGKARELLEKADWGTLSLAGADGTPYGVPVNHVFSGDRLYIHCALEGRKIDLVGENPRAAFCAVASAETVPESFTTRYASVMAEGRVFLAAGKEKRRGLDLLIEKYCPGLEAEGAAYIEKAFDATAVIVVEVETVSGKSNCL